MVEGAALEMLFRGNFNEGSNPSLSVLEPAESSSLMPPISWLDEAPLEARNHFVISLWVPLINTLLLIVLTRHDSNPGDRR